MKEACNHSKKVSKASRFYVRGLRKIITYCQDCRKPLEIIRIDMETEFEMSKVRYCKEFKK